MAYLYLLMVVWVVLQSIENFVAIDGVMKNQLDKYATGCNTQS
jgi:hypothetical protein